MAKKATPKKLFEKRNTSDIFVREVIAGVLSVLNGKLYYEQIWDEKEGKVENVTVPFFYDFGGGNPNSEKFIQDNYTFFADKDCLPSGYKKMDGNFDFYPRGIITLGQTQVQSGGITNRFVLGRYNRKVDGKIKAFVSFLYSIPLSISFKVEIRTDTMISAMKIEQAYREYFYRNKTFYINYKGTKCACRIGFPDSMSKEGANSYKMGSGDGKNFFTLSLDLSVEAYQPVWDKGSELPAEGYVKHVVSSVILDGKTKSEGNDTLVFIDKDMMENTPVPAGTELRLSWNHTNEFIDIPTVQLLYEDKETGKRNEIGVISHREFYDWLIPEELMSQTRIDAIIPNTDSVYVYTPPRIIVLPDPETNTVTPDNVYIVSKGLFLTQDKQVEGTLSYMDKSGELVEYPMRLNLLNNMIDLDNPIEFKDFKYTGDISYKAIDIIIKDVNKKDLEDVIENVMIM